MRKYHFSSAALSLSPFSANVEEIASSFDGWQIVAEGKQAADTMYDEFKDIASSYNLEYTMHAPFGDINIASLNREIRKASISSIVSCLQKGSELGVKRFVVHAGRHSVLSSFERERALVLSRDALVSLAELAKSMGVELLVENTVGNASVASTAEEMNRITAGLPIGVCLDLSHALLAGELDNFLRMRRRVGMVHVSDNDGRSDMHLQPGKGNVDFATLSKHFEGDDIPWVIEVRTVEEGIEGLHLIRGE